MIFEKICVIGLGYIGLPTAAMFAKNGKTVVGVDINKDVVSSINKGEIHIIEPGLADIVKPAVKAQVLRATDKIEAADAFIIAVPTPCKRDKEGNMEPDLSFIQAAVEILSPVINKGNLIILESTSPVGTTEKVCQWLAKLRPDLEIPHVTKNKPDISVAYCPERVLPGNVILELENNDRIIGGITKDCFHNAQELYRTFVKGECIATNARTAEMSKLTENASRDVQIAFANELSIICDKNDINVWELISIANRHPRVNILQPGPGVGGHCIAVDPWFIISQNENDAKIIKMARSINDGKPGWVINKIKQEIQNILQSDPTKDPTSITIACLGLAFKPNIDDLRESPAMEITRKIAELHPGRVIAVEPNIQKVEAENFSLVSYHHAESVADIAVLLVDHDEFKKVEAIKCPILIDTKGIWI